MTVIRSLSESSTGYGMRALSSDLRRDLEAAVLEGRHAAESGVRAAFSTLAVEDRDKPSHLSDEQAQLRRGLRAKQRQLGGDFDVLVWEAAYEQWHRLLFARFLAENNLLRHPAYDAPVTLEECEELAEELGEPDGWSVATRFAAEILPGIFRLDDPCVRLRLAPEHRIALEKIVEGLPSEVFVADDSLGWVYQYWQSERKDEVNASEDKVGGADLGPVTQLFTEDYMVRFLLENSLGAWWAARNPDSPLIGSFEYLRLDENGEPAGGTFDNWPDRVAEVTVMDPCCGSGHFLVEAFGMLWRMRAEEEGLDPVAAQDVVLRDNLFGLELDPRCVQIAMFAVALTAWKQGGGWRRLPVANIACSGIPVKAPQEEWVALGGEDERLRGALERLHGLFKHADTLGSLIDPRRVTESVSQDGIQRSFDDVDFEEVAPLFEEATVREIADPATAVLGADAAGIAKAAAFLSKSYTLAATNVPYLGRGKQQAVLKDFLDQRYPAANAELAAAFGLRCTDFAHDVCLVVPDSLGFSVSFANFREGILKGGLGLIAYLGAGAFSSISGEVVRPLLAITCTGRNRFITGVDASERRSISEKKRALRNHPVTTVPVSELEGDGEWRWTLRSTAGSSRIGDIATSTEGLSTGDDPRYRRNFWELRNFFGTRRTLGPPEEEDGNWSAGLESMLMWSRGVHRLEDAPGARLRGASAWGRAGILVGRTGSISCGQYEGQLFDKSCVALIPDSEELIAALFQFATSGALEEELRHVDRRVSVATKSLEKVPIDLEHWREVAAAEYPNGLPEPHSDDPTQWLFDGRPEGATAPLQVGVARLLGYRWPEQSESDSLEGLSDQDGIVCLPAVAGELSAADRLQELLAKAFGPDWSVGLLRRLIEQTESKSSDLAGWLRDDFFKHHCKMFSNRPFIWHIWDGRKDGFSALVNYHRLDRAGLEKLTYTYLGDWIERQRADAMHEAAGAALRLSAAEELKGRLETVLEGQPPYDIYVRWKELHEQPIGWDPDPDDGVRLNIRPFVEAGVLRSKFRVHWKKDRGKNPDGSERHNDLHFTIAEKQKARKEAGMA